MDNPGYNNLHFEPVGMYFVKFIAYIRGLESGVY